MSARVIGASSGASASTILRQRSPSSGTCNIAIRVASAAQRQSRSGIIDEAWRQSTCRDTYQKHAPVTSSLAVTIATFWTLPRDARGDSKSPATLLLIRTRPFPIAPTTGTTLLGTRRYTTRNARVGLAVQAGNRFASSTPTPLGQRSRRQARLQNRQCSATVAHHLTVPP